MSKFKRGNKPPPLPPLKSSDFERMLRADSWYETKGGRHPNWEHPTKPGKVQLPDYWTGVKTGSNPFRGVLAQTGWTKTEAIRLYWESR
jgi:predicted RNA binding protein YcfA (HicA-like mRNA interferase family)